MTDASFEHPGTLTSRFSPLDTAAWFEAEGVELKVRSRLQPYLDLPMSRVAASTAPGRSLHRTGLQVEPDGRVFPTSDDSGTVIEALLGVLVA